MVENDVIGNETQLVVFKLGTEEFGVDISQVREIIRVGDITRIPGSPRYVDGVINLRGQVMQRVKTLLYEAPLASFFANLLGNFQYHIAGGFWIGDFANAGPQQLIILD